VLASQDLTPGDTIQSGSGAPIKPGNTLPLKDIPVGMPINSIELHPNKGGQLCRAAGCMATIVNKQQEHAIVRLPSGKCVVIGGADVYAERTITRLLIV
jgi:large subunit ribosomal protein L2